MLSKHQQIFVLLATALLTFMSTVDMSIVNAALPQISKELTIPMNEAEWIASIYLIVICMLLVFFGKVGDQIGRSVVFQIGTIIFTISSLFSGISTNLVMLLIARGAQAIGSAMIMATSFGIITDLFPRQQHGRALAVNSVFAQVGNVSGPILAGLILSITSWHWLFLINLPVGIIAYLFGRSVFPKRKINLSLIRVDWAGFSVFAIVMLTFFLAIYIGQVVGYGQLVPVTLFITAAIAMIGFIMIENRVTEPMLNLSLFKQRGFSIGIIITTLVYMIVYFNNILMPFYLQNRLGFAPAKMSLFLMLVPLVNVFSSSFGGYMSDKIGPERISLYALIVLLLSCGLLALITPDWSILLLVVAFIFFGLGNGLFQNNPIIMDNAGAANGGIAGALASLSRNVGFSIGLAVSTSLLYFGMSIKAGHNVTTYPTHHPDWFTFGMHFSYGFTVIIVIITIILMGLLMNRKVVKR
ncbi:MFS transporter [Lactobacillaceae bacterium Melli_B4]